MPGIGGPYDFAYVHSDIPEGMTILEWRAERALRAAAARDAERRTRHDGRRAMLVGLLRRVRGGLKPRSSGGVPRGRLPEGVLP